MSGRSSIRALRDHWWVLLLAAIAAMLFGAGFVVRYRCLTGACPSTSLASTLDLDRLGGLPRGFTTGMFLGSAVFAGQARATTSGRPSTWWGAVTGIGIGLTLAKALSFHSGAKAALDPYVTLLVGAAITVPVLVALDVSGRRWHVAGTRVVTIALACYAAASLFLDLLTEALTAVQVHVGPLSLAACTFIEEFGEALTALAVLVVVRRYARANPRAGSRRPRW